jgi:hypothetical protein
LYGRRTFNPKRIRKNNKSKKSGKQIATKYFIFGTILIEYFSMVPWLTTYIWGDIFGLMYGTESNAISGVNKSGSGTNKEEASSPDLDHLAAEVAWRGLCDVRLLVHLQEVLRAHAHLALPALEHLAAKFRIRIQLGQRIRIQAGQNFCSNLYRYFIYTVTIIQ